MRVLAGARLHVESSTLSVELMAAPQGNQNAAKAKQWTAAIERALERMGDPSIDPDSPIPRAPKAKAMDELADTFVRGVKAGELPFFREFGDRIDGKPSQQLEHTGAGGGSMVFEKIERVVRGG